MCALLEVVGNTSSPKTSKKRKRLSSSDTLEVTNESTRRKRRRRRLHGPPLQKGKGPPPVETIDSDPKELDNLEKEVKKKKKKKEKKTAAEKATGRAQGDSKKSQSSSLSSHSNENDENGEGNLSKSPVDDKATSSTCESLLTSTPVPESVQRKRRTPKRSSKASGIDKAIGTREEREEKATVRDVAVQGKKKMKSSVKTGTPTKSGRQHDSGDSEDNSNSDNQQISADGDPVPTPFGENEVSSASLRTESASKRKDRKKKKGDLRSKSEAPSKGSGDEKFQCDSGKKEKKKSEKGSVRCEEEEYSHIELEAKVCSTEQSLDSGKTLKKKDRKKLKKSLKAAKADTQSNAETSTLRSEPETFKPICPVICPVDDEETESSKAVQTPTRTVTWADRKEIAEADGIESKKKRRSSGGSQPGTPFKRVCEDNVSYRDSRLMDNSFFSKDDTFGALAHKDLVVTRGKGFRKEKTKKKRLNHHGGMMNYQVNSFKFADDDSD